MNLELSLNIAGLILAVASLIAARITKQMLWGVFATALVITTAIAVYLDYQHERTLGQVQLRIKQKLMNSRWTSDTISAELPDDDKKLVRDALRRGMDRGMFGDQSTTCISSDGAVHTIRVYFNNN